MLAEAYNEENSLDKAVTELNKVRDRVGMPSLNNGSPWLAVNSQEEMRQRIRNERAYELPAEGHRYWDLRRWGYLWPDSQKKCNRYLRRFDVYT